MKKRLLVITPNLNARSGVANHIMNYYDRIKEFYAIDFILYEKNESKYTEKIKNEKNSIYFFNKRLTPSNIKRIESFFKENSYKYDIIHCHTFNYGYIYLHYAKKYGIKNRILHVHSIRYSDSLIKHFINKILLKLSRAESNIHFACSKDAGLNAFKNKIFYVINNCIDMLKYQNVKNETKEKLSNELELNNCFVFGNVGRLVNQKNHEFLIKLFNEIKKNDKYLNSKLLIIGDGPRIYKIQKMIRKYNLKNDVRFVSNVTNIQDYYSIMDCFVFPSKKEGLGLALIEAQASKLPCFCTDSLPKEVFISEQITGLDLKKGYKYWAEFIIRQKLKKNDVSKDIIKAGYDIDYESKKLINLYNEMLTGKSD